MTDGGVGPPIPSGTDDGWGGFGQTVPVREKKKLILGRQSRVEEDQSRLTFPSTNTTPLVTSLQLPPSHPYCERVTPRLEKEGEVGKFRSRF
jgi:hypothetical protein